MNGQTIGFSDGGDGEILKPARAPAMAERTVSLLKRIKTLRRRKDDHGHQF